MLHLVVPDATGVDHAGAEPFLQAVERALHVEHPTRSYDLAELLRDAGPDDAVVVFNHERMSPEAARALAALHRRGVSLFPVALTSDHVRPPPGTEDLHVFSVVAQLHARGRPVDQWEVAAHAFMTQLVAEWKPTCASRKLQIFISYGHDEHVDLARGLEAALRRDLHRPVRDVVDNTVGHEWRESLRRHLEECDLVLFVDTEHARRSEMVEWELRTALQLNVPVIWVRVDDGAAERKVDLRVPPASREDRLVTVEEIRAGRFEDLTDELMRLALDKRLSRLRATYDGLDQLDEMSRRKGLQLRPLDRRRHIYRVLAPCRNGRYPSRPHHHLVQLYGRQPGRADQDDLDRWIREHPVGTDGEPIGEFDARILLAPAPIVMSAGSDGTVTDYITSYVNSVAADPATATASTSSDRPDLLVLGAFPDEVVNQQLVKDAVHQVVTTWLERRGRITFGGHPTFTPLIQGVLEAAGMPREHVTVYQSLRFVEQARVNKLDRSMRAITTPEMDDDTSALMEMRRRMVGESGAAAAIAIGGKTHLGLTPRPGIDDEIDLARARRIPVFLLAGPGGQAARLADEVRRGKRSWPEFNDMTVEQNDLLVDTIRFAYAAHQIFDHVTGTAT